MARRLTTNQEIAGSIPASINKSSPQQVQSLLRYHHTFSSKYGVAIDDSWSQTLPILPASYASFSGSLRLIQKPYMSISKEEKLPVQMDGW